MKVKVIGKLASLLWASAVMIVAGCGHSRNDTNAIGRKQDKTDLATMSIDGTKMRKQISKYIYGQFTKLL